MRRLAPLLGLLLVLAACGGDDAEPGQGDTTSPTGQATTTTEGQATSTTEGPAELGLDTIGVLTPAEGNGERPLLAWEPVAEAAQYAVTVSTADGKAYWAWVGEDTSVYLGGGDGATDTVGPILSEPMTMTVLALDAAHAVLAASPPTPIAP
jgi:hypothetical protein